MIAKKHAPQELLRRTSDPVTLGLRHQSHRVFGQQIAVADQRVCGDVTIIAAYWADVGCSGADRLK